MEWSQKEIADCTACNIIPLLLANKPADSFDHGNSNNFYNYNLHLTTKMAQQQHLAQAW